MTPSPSATTTEHDQPPVTAITYTRAASGSRNQLTAQRAALDHVAATSGAAITAEFTDHGSGRTLNRPGLRALLAFITTHHIDYCLTYRTDRLARDHHALAQITGQLERSGVRVITATETIDQVLSAIPAVHDRRRSTGRGRR